MFDGKAQEAVERESLRVSRRAGVQLFLMPDDLSGRVLPVARQSNGVSSNLYIQTLGRSRVTKCQSPSAVDRVQIEHADRLEGGLKGTLIQFWWSTVICRPLNAPRGGPGETALAEA